MTRIYSLLAATAAAAFAFAATAHAAPLAVYGGLPSLEDVAISPSGRFLAIDLVKSGQRTLIVQDLVAKKIVTGVKLGAAKVRDIEWAGDSHLIITASSYQKGILGVFGGEGEWFTATDFNIATQKLSPLMGDVDQTGNMIYGAPVVRLVDGKPMLFTLGVHFVGERSALSLFKIDLGIDRSQVVLDGDVGADDIIVGADGRPAAETTYDALSKQWSLRLSTGGGWKQVATRTAAIETPSVGGLGRDGRSIVLGERVEGEYALREFSPTGAISDPLPGPIEGAEIHDPATHALIGMATLDGDTMRYHFYASQDQAKWDGLERAFPNMNVVLHSWSDDRSKVVVHIDSPADGPGYVFVDLSTGGLAWLGGEYAGLGGADISTVQPVAFKAADGLPLTGYLTLPKGKDPKNLPLVVFPHGGPGARDEPGFDWWAQAMASQGYAVLQVNYRGSDGFGWKFMSAGFGEWGRKMQTDLSDGVRYLAAQGTIDPKRVCIVGASYGGYAALAGATLDTGVYRCAVDVSGLSDLGRFIAWGAAREDGRQSVGVERWWDRYMGAKTPTDPHLADISPAEQVAKVSIPILIIHGKDDSVVPFEQSQIMADALKKAGKPYDFVVLNHEDHWLSSSDTRQQMLQSTVDFLAKNNPAS